MKKIFTIIITVSILLATMPAINGSSSSSTKKTTIGSMVSKLKDDNAINEKKSTIMGRWNI